MKPDIDCNYFCCTKYLVQYLLGLKIDNQLNAVIKKVIIALYTGTVYSDT